jgi:hypothetical protein
MDRGVEIYGKKHREFDPYHGKGTRTKAKGLDNGLMGCTTLLTKT